MGHRMCFPLNAFVAHFYAPLEPQAAEPGLAQTLPPRFRQPCQEMTAAAQVTLTSGVELVAWW